jgi:hypothetical protein
MKLKQKRGAIGALVYSALGLVPVNHEFGAFDTCLCSRSLTLTTDYALRVRLP